MSFPGCVSGLRCVKCGERYARGLDGPCAACGPEGVLEVEYDLARARRTLTPRALRSRPLNAWRYAELLPVPSENTAIVFAPARSVAIVPLPGTLQSDSSIDPSGIVRCPGSPRQAIDHA